MLPRPFVALGLLSFLIVPAATQSLATLTSALDEAPECATGCLTTALMSGFCPPTDVQCICGSEQFQGNVTLCVSGSCTIPEALATKNISNTICDVPVRDRSQVLVNVSNTFVIVAGAFVIIRFAYKLFVIKLDFGLDDWFVLAAMVAAGPSAAINVYGTTANGFGKDIWTLPPEKITNAIMYFYHMAWMYFFETTLTKLSIICFYLRIFPTQGIQRMLWGTFIFTATWGLAYTLVAVLQCQPIHYFWTQWDGLHEGHCADANAVGWSNAAMNIALDLWILALPLSRLPSLQLHWKKKVGVAVMFIMGTFVTVVSILRLRSLVRFAATSNTTWDFFDVTLWSTVEISAGIMCACLPTVRLCLVKLFPVLAGSTRKKNTEYYKYGSGAWSKPSAPHSRATHEVSAERTSSEQEPSAVQGIVLQQSYDIQYSDNDEASLVRMKHLDEAGKAC